MKRILMLASAIALIATANAQKSGTSFGFKAGVTFQNLTGKDLEGDKLNNDLRAGISAGVNAQIPIATDFYVQPGLEFNQKGATGDGSKTRINYLEVPISLVYKPTVGSGHVIFGFGPYVGYAVGGKVKYDNGREYDVNFQNDMTLTELSSGNPYARRLDAGANIFAGYEMSNKLSVQLNTQLGLAKINPAVEGLSGDKSSVKNTGFGVTLGYRM